MAEQTPLHELEKAAGAVFVEDAGWLVPAHFGDSAAEYSWAREGTAVFDLSHWGKIELAGPDARTFLHNLCTNDIQGLAAGTLREAFLATAQARVVAHVFVHASGESLWLSVAPGVAEKVIPHLDRHLISERVEIIDRTRDFALLRLVGPNVGTVCEGSVSHNLLGLPGCDMYMPRDEAPDSWRKLTSRGIRPAGIEAYDILRIEGGLPKDGVDIDESTLVPEVGRTAQAVSYSKGCYLGQEPIVRIRDLGHVNRALLGLRIAGSDEVPAGAKLFHEGKEVGQVTSSIRSPRLGVIALAYVRRGNEPGTVLEIEIDGTQRSAEVSGLPFSPGDSVVSG